MGDKDDALPIRAIVLDRNRIILTLHRQGISRKQIAFRIRMRYDAVKKVIQKYADISRPVIAS